MTEPILDATNLLPGALIYTWSIEKKIALGDFSHVYLTNQIGQNGLVTKFAIKCEPADSPIQMLKVEAYILNKIHKKGSRHFCDVEDIGKYAGVNYIVMNLVGRPLVDYMKASKTGVISVNCALSVGIQIYEALEDLHSAGYIHRDVKPSNICLGRKDRNELSKIYLLSFSISKKYLDGKGELRKPRDKADFRGTTRYASQSCHQLMDLGRKDDLESLFYVICEMITGVLPWKGLPDGAAVARTKQQARYAPVINQLLRGACPFEELKELMFLIDGYTFYSTPNYSKIYDILRRGIRRTPMIQEHPYDWESNGPNFLPDV